MDVDETSPTYGINNRHEPTVNYPPFSQGRTRGGLEIAELRPMPPRSSEIEITNHEPSTTISEHHVPDLNPARFSQKRKNDMCTYDTLCGLAISESPDQIATVDEILCYTRENFDFRRGDKHRVYCSIRAALNTKKYFDHLILDPKLAAKSSRYPYIEKWGFRSGCTFQNKTFRISPDDCSAQIRTNGYVPALLPNQVKQPYTYDVMIARAITDTIHLGQFLATVEEIRLFVAKNYYNFCRSCRDWGTKIDDRLQLCVYFEMTTINLMSRRLQVWKIKKTWMFITAYNTFRPLAFFRNLPVLERRMVAVPSSPNDDVRAQKRPNILGKTRPKTDHPAEQQPNLPAQSKPESLTEDVQDLHIHVFDETQNIPETPVSLTSPELNSASEPIIADLEDDIMETTTMDKENEQSPFIDQTSIEVDSSDTIMQVSAEETNNDESMLVNEPQLEKPPKRTPGRPRKYAIEDYRSQAIGSVRGIAKKKKTKSRRTCSKRSQHWKRRMTNKHTDKSESCEQNEIESTPAVNESALNPTVTADSIEESMMDTSDMDENLSQATLNNDQEALNLSAEESIEDRPAIETTILQNSNHLISSGSLQNELSQAGDNEPAAASRILIDNSTNVKTTRVKPEPMEEEEASPLIILKHRKRLGDRAVPTIAKCEPVSKKAPQVLPKKAALLHGDRTTIIERNSIQQSVEVVDQKPEIFPLRPYKGVVPLDHHDWNYKSFQVTGESTETELDNALRNIANLKMGKNKIILVVEKSANTTATMPMEIMEKSDGLIVFDAGEWMSMQNFNEIRDDGIIVPVKVPSTSKTTVSFVWQRGLRLRRHDVVEEDVLSLIPRFFQFPLQEGQIIRNVVHIVHLTYA